MKTHKANFFLLPLFLFQLLGGNILISQELLVTYGIDYKEQISELKKNINNSPDLNVKTMGEFTLKAQIEAEKSIYELKIKQQQSFFSLVPILLNDSNNPVVNALSKTISDKGDFYQNSIDKSIIELDAVDKKKLIAYSFDFYNWSLTKETQNILGFTCYKATTEYIEPHPNGGKDIIRRIIVWYSPELPFNFGPQGYGGLPGLILKKCQNGSCFTVKEINYKPVSFTWPKGEVISREKYFEQFKTTTEIKF